MFLFLKIFASGSDAQVRMIQRLSPLLDLNHESPNLSEEVTVSTSELLISVQRPRAILNMS